MSRRIGLELPVTIAADIRSGSPPLRAVPVTCIDEEGFPHPALLSLLEFLLLEERLYFHLHSSSRSKHFLFKRPLCTCLFLTRQGCYYLKCRTSFECELEGRAVFQLHPQHVLEDTAPAAEVRASLLSGLDFAMSPQVVQGLAEVRERIIEGLAQRAI